MELYRKVESSFVKTSIEVLKQLHDKLEYDETGFKNHITYYELSENGHLLERHFKCETANSPDGCPYCAAGFTRCGVCGANDYGTSIEGDGEVSLIHPCPLIKQLGLV